MALERKDRIRETTTTTGTGTLNLSGTAPTGFRTFISAVTSGATVRYLIESADSTEWEVGEGVFTDATPDTLSRVTVYASSNAGSKVNFSAGEKVVSLTLTARDEDVIGEDVENAITDSDAVTDPTDAGVMAVVISGVLKKITWANIKATLLTWLRLGTTILPQNSPRGHLINGKIVPSVNSNNLTVAIKGLDGNDPSATNPVYVRIGDTIRSITSALSVTKNAGTNWFNAGSTELATFEIDYFVYLGYNATDGVVIGFSRFPNASEYDDFSTTSTNEKYCAISTITNAVAGDDYELIGRFAATLSAGAGYTWSVPTFTNKNLVQKEIRETRWLKWNGVLSWTAGAAPTSENTDYKISTYKIVGNTVYFNSLRVFTNAGTTITVVTQTAPFTSSLEGTTSTQYCFFGSIAASSGGAYNIGYMVGGTNSLAISCASATGTQYRAQGFYII